MDDVLPSKLTQRRLKMMPLHYSQTNPEERKLYQKFVDAAELGNLNMVETMIQANTVPMDCSGSIWDSQMALYRASSMGHVHIVQALIKAGAHVNGICLHDGTTALHAACDNCSSVLVVELLIKVGAQVDLQDKRG